MTKCKATRCLAADIDTLTYFQIPKLRRQFAIFYPDNEKIKRFTMRGSDRVGPMKMLLRQRKSDLEKLPWLKRENSGAVDR
jgi:hypothetical protein